MPEFVLAVMEEMQKGKFNHDITFYHSVCNTLAKILLVKANHMLSPKLRGRKLHFISSGGICKITRTGYGYKEKSTTGEGNSICCTPILICIDTISHTGHTSTLKSIKNVGVEKSLRTSGKNAENY